MYGEHTFSLTTLLATYVNTASEFSVFDYALFICFHFFQKIPRPANQQLPLIYEKSLKKHNHIIKSMIFKKSLHEKKIIFL